MRSARPEQTFTSVERGPVCPGAPISCPAPPGVKFPAGKSNLRNAASAVRKAASAARHRLSPGYGKSTSSAFAWVSVARQCAAPKVEIWTARLLLRPALVVEGNLQTGSGRSSGVAASAGLGSQRRTPARARFRAVRLRSTTASDAQPGTRSARARQARDETGPVPCQVARSHRPYPALQAHRFVDGSACAGPGRGLFIQSSAQTLSPLAASDSALCQHVHVARGILAGIHQRAQFSVQRIGLRKVLSSYSTARGWPLPSLPRRSPRHGKPSADP